MTQEEVGENRRFFKSLALQQDRDAAVVRAYETAPEMIRKSRLVVHTCKAKGCVLLTAWASPLGLAFYQRRHKVQRNVNLTTSTPEARERHTEDGDNHWKAVGGLLHRPGLDGADTLTLRCDHVEERILVADVWRDSAKAVRGKPTRQFH